MNYLRCLKATNSFLQFSTVHNFIELTNISKLSSKYSTVNNSEKAVKIPAASRWRNVRGCVKPEHKQKPLKFTQNATPSFDLLKSKQQLHITC